MFHLLGFEEYFGQNFDIFWILVFGFLTIF